MRLQRIGVVVILLLAFCGLADSTYLAQHAESGAPLICNADNLSGCNTVATSPYSRLFGIPLAEFGVLFYGILFVLAALELVLFDRLLRRALQIAAVVGIIASLYFVSVQLFLIGAFCIYCIASGIITLLILLFAGLIEPMPKKKNNNTPIITPPPASPPRLSMPPAA